MVMVGKLIKALDQTGKVIFIGPCTAKKYEFKSDAAKAYIDCVLSFEELQAFLDARNVDVSELADTEFDNASYYGRIFARSGGVAEGITRLSKERGFKVKSVVMSGLDECKKQLTLLKTGKSPFNFFEGMACDGGCINGALCLHHGNNSLSAVNEYGEMAKEKTIDSSVELYEIAERNNKK